MLPEIPVVRDADTPFGLFYRAPERTRTLVDMCRTFYGGTMLDAAGYAARRWWEHNRYEPYGDEVASVARLLGDDAVYALNLSYEWGCTTAFNKTASSKTQGVTMFRAMDWALDGLGDKLVLARMVGGAGLYWAMTYPGYIGVLQGMAPKRFSLAINQAPAPDRGLGRVFNLAADKIATYRSGNIPPSFLLRRVFEQCTTFNDAVNMLCTTPISTPAIFSIVGVHARDHCIIERSRTRAVPNYNTMCVGNEWLFPGWKGVANQTDSKARVAQMASGLGSYKGQFDWLNAPVLCDRTRLAFEANARTGQVVVQGFEGGQVVTRPRYIHCML